MPTFRNFTYQGTPLQAKTRIFRFFKKISKIHLWMFYSITVRMDIIANSDSLENIEIFQLALLRK